MTTCLTGTDIWDRKKRDAEGEGVKDTPHNWITIRGPELPHVVVPAGGGRGSGAGWITGRGNGESLQSPPSPWTAMGHPAVLSLRFAPTPRLLWSGAEVLVRLHRVGNLCSRTFLNIRQHWGPSQYLSFDYHDPVHLGRCWLYALKGRGFLLVCSCSPSACFLLLTAGLWG